MSLTVGQKAPDISLADQGGKIHNLKNYQGKWVVVYFYPKDDTIGCTKEACNFRDNYKTLQQKNIVVLGISKDSMESHQTFAKKYQLPFPLLSDPEKITIEEYQAWGAKKFLGKSFEGIKRKSVLINPQGLITKIYQNVRPIKHAEKIINDVENLTNQ